MGILHLTGAGVQKYGVCSRAKKMVHGWEQSKTGLPPFQLPKPQLVTLLFQKFPLMKVFIEKKYIFQPVNHSPNPNHCMNNLKKPMERLAWLAEFPTSCPGEW